MEELEGRELNVLALAACQDLLVMSQEPPFIGQRRSGNIKPISVSQVQSRLSRTIIRHSKDELP